jgi:hypothetical protein
MKAPVTLRSVIARINRKLKPDLEALKMARGDRMRLNVGHFYVVDYKMNAVTRVRVDPEQMGRDLGVLKPFEEVIWPD